MIMRTAKALLTGMALLCASAARMAAGDEIAGGITSFINRLHPSGTPYFVTYSINRDINFSELEAVLRNDPWFDFPQKRLYFRSFFLQLDDGSGYPDGNPRGIDIPSKIVVDAVSAWTAAQKDLSFFECAVELNGYRLPGVEKLRYHVTNYDPLFYRSFPNVENLDITASGIPDLSFLWRLEKLKKFEISLKEQDKTVLNRLFRQYYDYITTAKTGLEGYVNIKSPYHYPHYDPDGDYIHYYTDPPEWYNGPDISGVPAWLNDDRVNLRREPSLTAPALKQLNTGDFVLIKGRAEIYENTMVYSEGTPWSYAMPWSSEAEYRDEMKQAGKWIKVRLADGTDGYIWGDYLTLKNPRFYPYGRIGEGITLFLNSLYSDDTSPAATYFIERDISFSELAAALVNAALYFYEARLYFKGYSLQAEDESGRPGGNPRGINVPSRVIVDRVSEWQSERTDMAFSGCAVELNGYEFREVKKLLYHVTNYDPLFYRSFPNVENLDIAASGIPDLSFLRRLEKLKKFEISLKEQDKTVLNRLFRQYYDYITTAKTGLEGYVNIKSPYHYPHYDPGGDYIHYYTDPPEWYNGPDISGVPAWLNDDRVNLRREPSLTAPALKQLNTGDFVLIKGRAEIYENTMVYSEGTPWSYAMPWSSEAEYRDEMKQAGKWIKVRLADGTGGYIWGDYLTLKNPRFYPYQKGASAGTFPASRP